MRDNKFTRILDWLGYRVFRHEIDKTDKKLRLWVRRKRRNRKLVCSGCRRKFSGAHDDYQRQVPWRKYRTTVIIELYPVCCRYEHVPLECEGQFMCTDECEVSVSEAPPKTNSCRPTHSPRCSKPRIKLMNK